MTETETLEDELSAANSLLAWFQGADTDSEPMLTGQAKERLEEVGVPEDYLRQLRAVISRISESDQRKSLWLHFSGFGHKVLEHLLGDDHKTVVEASLGALGLFAIRLPDQTPPEIPEDTLREIIEKAPAAKRPARVRRSVGANVVKKVAPKKVLDEIEGDGPDEPDDDGVIDKDDTSLVTRSRPTTVDVFAADPTLGEKVVTTDNVRAFMNTAGKIALLSATQEVELAKRIEAGVLAQDLLDSDEKSAIEATDDELRIIVAEGEEAKTHMLEANLRLVMSVAKKFQGRGLEYLDLIQEGNLGLVRAVEKFDYTKGYKFSTYATWWIKQNITRGIANSGRTIRLPVHMEELARKVKNTENQFMQQNGRAPSPEELARETSLSPERVVEILHYSRRVASLDQSLTDKKGDPGDTSLGDIVASQPDTSEHIIQDIMAREVLDNILGILDMRAREMIELRYGIKDGRDHTLREVGEEWGITPERTRQILAAAMHKVRVHTSDLGIDVEDLFDDLAEA